MLRVQHTLYNKCTVIGILMNDLQSLNITASVSVFRLTHSLSDSDALQTLLGGNHTPGIPVHT